MCYTTWVFACEVDVLFGRPSKETPFSLFLQCFSPFIHLFPHFACLFGISLRNSWVTQEITKPEESIRIKWSVCLLGIFCSCKFKEEVISFWPKCPALVLCLGKGAWVILICMLYYEARTIPQNEVQTLPAPGFFI